MDQVGLDQSQAGSNRSSILDRSSVPDRSLRFTQRSSGILEDFGKGRSLNANMDSCGLDEAALNRRPLRKLETAWKHFIGSFFSLKSDTIRLIFFYYSNLDFKLYFQLELHKILQNKDKTWWTILRSSHY